MILVPVVLALALAPAAAPPKGKWVALVHTEGEVPASWRDTLRKAAEDAKGRTWTDPPAVTLEEAQLALGCAEWGPACAGQVAQMTGANVALLVNLKSSGAGIALSAEAVQSNGAPAKGRNEVLLPDASDDTLKFAVAWVKGSLADKLPALLIVETATPGAEVSLDGRRVGTTERGPVHVVVENPGTHTLLVTKAGAAPVTKELKLSPNDTLKELIAVGSEAPPLLPNPRLGDPKIVKPLVPEAPQPPPVADSTGAVVGWSLAGIGGVVALASGVVAATVANDLYFLRVPCGVDDKGSCVPQTVSSPLGLYSYAAPDRGNFFTRDGPTLLTVTSVVATVGVLLGGTGVWLALAAPSGAPPAAE